MCMCANVDGLVPVTLLSLIFSRWETDFMEYTGTHTRINADSQSKTHLVTPLSAPVPPVEKAIFLLFRLHSTYPIQNTASVKLKIIVICIYSKNDTF